MYVRLPFVNTASQGQGISLNYGFAGFSSILSASMMHPLLFPLASLKWIEDNISETIRVNNSSKILHSLTPNLFQLSFSTPILAPFFLNLQIIILFLLTTSFFSSNLHILYSLTKLCASRKSSGRKQVWVDTAVTLGRVNSPSGRSQQLSLDGSLQRGQRRNGECGAVQG